MTPERWRDIEAAFHQAASLSPAERSALLNSLPADLRLEVQALLDAEQLPLTLSDPIRDAIATLDAPQRLGPYRILSELGSGGMGTVYKATRDDDAFLKTVAIKTLRGTLANTQLEQRFLAERQILAQLEHPHIARLLDGGSHHGLPYIVMEFIEGQPITAFASNNQLDPHARLALFLKVCEAVQHAHQRLIVHRDLKPGNILVQPDATPKLLDFGIAKLLDQSAENLTQTGYRLMTPDYASPEQVRGEAITVASDVYSLGVILYELLTNRRPYQLKTYSPTEIQQLVCEQPVPAPNLDADLDTILLNALHKDPSRRYSSVEKFSGDIQRYLTGQPITARPDTFLYRSTKFIQRNRLAVALSTILILTTLTGAALVYRQGLRSQRRFTQVRALANRVLTEFDEEASKLPGNTRLRSIMVRASMEYLDSLAAESTNDPDLQHEVAFAYAKVGDTLGYQRASNLNQPFEAALAYNKAIALCTHPRSRHLLAYLYAHYASLLPRLGKSSEVIPYFERALPLLDGADPATIFEVRHGYGQVLLMQGDLDRAAAILEPVLTSMPRSAVPQIPINIYRLASSIEAHRGNLSEAIRFNELALALSRAAGRATVGLERLAALLLLERARLEYSFQYPSRFNPCAALPFAIDATSIAFKLARFEATQSTSAIHAIDTASVYASVLGACRPQANSSVYQESLALYRRLKLAPQSADASEAFSLLRLGQPQQALQLLAPYLEGSNQEIDTLRIAGEIHLALNQPRQAIAFLAPALKALLQQQKSRAFDAILYRERVLPVALLLGDAYLATN